MRKFSFSKSNFRGETYTIEGCDSWDEAIGVVQKEYELREKEWEATNGPKKLPESGPTPEVTLNGNLQVPVTGGPAPAPMKFPQEEEPKKRSWGR